MGNSQTKEARGHASQISNHDSGSTSPMAGRDIGPSSESEPTNRPRARHGSRSDFTSFLGIGGTVEQDASSLEARRESKMERDVRRAEKEKQTRLKERERSMKEEHVDGGYLVTLGVYVGSEDYNKSMVRQLMIERRLAPFWRGLNEYSESWAEHQLMAAARGMPIPPADQVPPELEYSPTKRQSPTANRDQVKSMTIAMGSRTESFHSQTSGQMSPANGSLPVPSSPIHSTSASSGGPLFRARAKTLASLTSSRTSEQKDMAPREFQLPPDPFVNGQPLEVYLYKDANECPICFLSYPPYLNTTRCCEQPICSECFVQIKRPEPHPPEHEQPDPNAPPMLEEDRQAQAEGLLVSEVATCPYCKQPEFGITYTPPPFRRGLTYGIGSQPYQVRSAMSSQTSIASGQMSPGAARRRGTSLSATAPEVITTDKIRPDWASKLAAARAHAARRSAAATALHAAAYLMNGQSERPAFPAFGRRGMLRRSTIDGDERMNPNLDMLRDSGIFLPPPRGSSSRRNRMDDLEDMMMMEAIRLSLAAEEDRRRKEEKDAKKKAKKDEKDNKKAEKAARKNSLFTINSNTSTGEGSIPIRSNDPSSMPDEIVGKGKGIARPAVQVDGSSRTGNQLPRGSALTNMLQSETSQESLSSNLASPAGIEPLRRSHLRQMSNASSASSSFVDHGAQIPGSSTPPGNASLEPMFNFRSLTAMVTEDEKAEDSAHIEHAEDEAGHQASFEALDDSPSPTSQSSGHDHSNGNVSMPVRLGKEVDISVERADSNYIGRGESTT